MVQNSDYMPINYFSCTLGEAATNNVGNPKHFKTVCDLVNTQAREDPQNYAVGFPDTEVRGQQKIYSM